MNKILGRGSTLRLACDAVGGDYREDELTLYPPDDDVDTGKIADGLVDSHVHVHASLRRELHAILELCHSGNVAVPVDANGFFNFALQSLSAMLECNSAMAAKAVVLRCMHVGEKIKTASLPGWTFEKIRMVC